MSERTATERSDETRNAAVPHRRPHEALSTAQLLARGLDQMRALLRRELDLARAEADASIRHAGAAMGLVAGALVVGLNAVAMLAGACVVLVSETTTVPPWLAAAIVGGALALAALAFAAAARAALQRVRLAPTRAAENLRDDVQILTDGARDD
jgi:hypothetical protein